MAYCQGCADLQGEISRTVDELVFWKNQAIWHRAYLYDGREPDEVDQRRAEHELEAARIMENRERYNERSGTC